MPSPLLTPWISRGWTSAISFQRVQYWKRVDDAVFRMLPEKTHHIFAVGKRPLFGNKGDFIKSAAQTLYLFGKDAVKAVKKIKLYLRAVDLTVDVHDKCLISAPVETGHTVKDADRLILLHSTPSFRLVLLLRSCIQNLLTHFVYIV